MENKRYLKIFSSQSEYESQKDEVMGMPHVVLLDDTKEVVFASENNENETEPSIDYSKEFFTIEALGDGLTVQLSKNASEYRIDSGEWTSLAANTETPSINKGQKISFKIANPTISSNFPYYGIGTFTANKSFNVEGNVMSLLYGDNFKGQIDLSGKDNAFYNLFKNCTTLQNAENLILPATKLAKRCYDSMFSGCRGLTTALELPATTLANGCYLGMFYNCTSLTSAPELPATTLEISCYSEMFYGCTSLVEAPELPATTLANSCYRYMFGGCTSLTAAPELLATTLALECYFCMFDGCTSLTAAPELPATTLANGCYRYMFNGCKSLTKAPELPATTLVGNCYSYMFKGCTSLTAAPELPATTLTPECYFCMFYDCSKLNYIKMLATDISAYVCLDNWVGGVAPNGTFIKHESMTSLLSGNNGIPNGWIVTNTFNDISPCIINQDSESITFVYSDGLFTPTNEVIDFSQHLTKEELLSVQPECEITVTLLDKTDNVLASDYVWANDKTLDDVLNELGVTNDVYDINVIITKVNAPEDSGYYYYNTIEENPYSKEFFTIEALGDGTVGIGIPPEATSLKYRKNNESWIETSEAIQLSVVANDTIQISCVSDYFNDGCSTLFAISTPFNVKGNIMSLLYGDNFKGQTDLSGKDYAFFSLLYNSTLQNAENLILPATTLADSCYRNMFSDCTSLTTAPELPSTTLALECYFCMFRNCTSLTTAPQLPATTLADNCYQFMFQGCTSLTTAPSILPATTLAYNCYDRMFESCTSLTEAPELPSTTLANGCYSAMFDGCTSLTTAPQLPATTLADNCYYEMFRGCSKLNKITMLATKISASYCLYKWVEGVASSGTFVKNATMTSLPSGVSGIPEGWTVENV